MFRHGVIVLAVVSALAHTGAALSIPSSQETSGEREAAIAATAGQIFNTKRTFSIAGVQYPFYDGPVNSPGSLTLQIQNEELQKLITFRSTQPQSVVSIATTAAATLTNVDAITNLYTLAESIIEKPMAMDNSDETFGLQRLTHKSFALRLATPSDLKGAEISLTDSQLAEKCGKNVTPKTLVASNRLFVDDFSDAAQWNDPARPEKYAPNVVGFFCFNKDSQKLLPIEIRYPDTKLAYTPYDTADEWTLAKMGLEAASVQYHQMAHMGETHTLTIPMRVEMLRNMAEQHPVRALLMHHVYADFALEMQVAVILLNTTTMLDQTFAWGASGSTRFLGNHINTKVSFKNDFVSDYTKRGLQHIPTHKYVQYGKLYQETIHEFVASFLNVYYATDAAVVADKELQNWAKATVANVAQLKDFPSSFPTKAALADTLTHVIFLCTVRHHGMNGMATWHSMTVPYSPAALWKPLPTAKLQKDEKLNLREYTVPTAVIPVALALGATFFRPVPEAESMLAAYTTSPFSDESRLEQSIKAFRTNLQTIDAAITAGEKNEKWPYEVLRPSRLSHYTWV
ncbi:hypothetical protein Poli38472_012442 [Pythium oligandrum]|uniref:Lipoxygenase domain-containing protein n=1 Tax=Pythium oligandrum TaxID=41045 RepID=A0A8K1CPB5_PYTOL|nr:hypothetical protein Poli38472_012442 [Pythium oligandrum]|eukprot:TMW67326.1 hypothetical protein Poli38472_012442 [Pythium oligandrum]